MTNKPMLSVELRALLERVATEADHMLGFTYASNYDECRKAVDELHPFLDNQAAQHQGDKVSIERIDIQMLKGGKFRFISEPEGSLVFYRDHADLVEALSLEVARLNRVKFSLAEKAAAHADNCAVCRIQLAERPAPVAEVMPEFESAFEAWWESDGQYCRAGGGSYEKTFAYRAYEAALAEVTRLNTPQ